MKVIVTGALGHIGSKLIRDLGHRFQGASLVMIDDLSTQRYSSLFNLATHSTYSFIEKKVQDVAWDDVLPSTDWVIHLAATTDAAGTANKPELVYENNFKATQILSDACLTHGVSFLFPSSTSVYGSQASQVDETCHDLLPQSPYAECKIKEEEYLKTLFLKGLKGIICRFGTIYGTSPGMRFHTAVNKFCWQAVMKQPVTVWKTALHQKRPYLSLHDCTKAIEQILCKDFCDGQIYNIVSNNFTVHDVIDTIKIYVPHLDIELVEHQIMNQLSYEVLADKFVEKGFEFTGELSAGIAETIALLKSSNRGVA